MEKEKKYRIIGYSALHYGKDFLREALLSVRDHVDKFVILYTETPSYGFGTEMKCPDGEIEMLNIALEVMGDKLIWAKGGWGQEGAHRGEILRYSAGYDGILAIDSDEVYCQQTLPIAIDKAMTSGRMYSGFGGYINFWRSFNHACYDGFTPIRFINLRSDVREGNEVVPCTVYHFSCVQRREIMQYKYEIHGHKNEIRPDWLNSIYYGDQMIDVHPTSFGIWNATPFDKTTLPDSLKNHPYYNLDRI